MTSKSFRFKNVGSKLIRLLLIFLLIFETTLSGCGGGGGGGESTGSGSQSTSIPPENNVNLKEANGSIDLTAIGGQGLQITNAYMGGTSADVSGNFKAITSSEGAQLTLAKDSSGQVRGLTIAVPSDSLSWLVAVSAAAGSTPVPLFLLSVIFFS